MHLRACVVASVSVILGLAMACGSSNKKEVLPAPEAGAAGEVDTGGSNAVAGSGGRPAGGTAGRVDLSGGAAGEGDGAGSGGAAGDGSLAGSGGAAGDGDGDGSSGAAGDGNDAGSGGNAHAGAAGGGAVVGLGKLSAAWQNTCALKANGTAACWGYNSSGQLGTGKYDDYWTPFTLPLPELVTSVAAGETQTCAIGVSGTLYCSGNVVATHHAIAGLSSVKSVVINASRICALVDTGAVYCLGNATATPVEVLGALGLPLTGVVALAAGRFHNCALLNDAHVLCWGANTSGQLGNGLVNPPETPSETNAVPVGGLSGDVKTVVGGAAYTCALMTDGTVQCWGGNGGIFGTGSLTPALSPFPVTVPGVSDVAALAGGESMVCAAGTTGSVRCWGYGSMGNGNVNESQPTAKLVAGLSNVGALAAGFQHTCALRKDGSLACWGSSQHGQLGLADFVPRNTPEDVPGGAIWAAP
jgi:alpha-tubulin suppressor-like RCC1 family protein